VDLGIINLEVSFYFDVIVAIMLLMVSFISLLVHIYSIEYMSHDPNFNRFIAYLSLFTFFMFLLVSADSFIQMFFG
jgi:NADH-quinone oxidoreductase subunit L